MAEGGFESKLQEMYDWGKMHGWEPVEWRDGKPHPAAAPELAAPAGAPHGMGVPFGGAPMGMPMPVMLGAGGGGGPPRGGRQGARR